MYGSVSENLTGDFLTKKIQISVSEYVDVRHSHT